MIINEKQKKWKRKAKRLIGYCSNQKNCKTCKYYLEEQALMILGNDVICKSCTSPVNIPYCEGIRNCEKYFKNKQ